MNFHYTNLETCHEATGVVVVIDVPRHVPSRAERRRFTPSAAWRQR
jgi:hypothetical protein